MGWGTRSGCCDDGPYVTPPTVLVHIQEDKQQAYPENT
jgi:hypothetical protein